MVRNYTLDDKTFAGLILFAGLAGVSLFVAGVLVGAHWMLPAATAAASQPAAPPRGLSATALPVREPVPPATEPEPPLAEAERYFATEPALPPAPAFADAVPEPNPGSEAEPGPSPSAPAARAVVAASPALPPGQFSLQVGAFLVTENLETALAELRERGYQPRVVPVTSSHGQVLSTVRVGAYTSRAEADEAALRFRQLEGKDALVRSVLPGSSTSGA